MNAPGYGAKPPAVAMKETLDQIATTLATLVTHQQKQADSGSLLADCRRHHHRTVGVMHSQTRDMLQRLDSAPAAHAPVPPATWASCLAGVAGLVDLQAALLVGGLWSLVATRTL